MQSGDETQSGDEMVDAEGVDHGEVLSETPSAVSGRSLISVEAEMGKSYLDYAMSVIVSRALPDVRDGMKPVHRRIVYAMEEGGYAASKPHRKSARIVGDVMGKYHPHGDSAIYDTLVRLAQPWQMRVPLVDGQGNFGSLDGDSAAAMRYTEARMARVAHDLTADIDKDTVDFRPTYDGSGAEPSVLPTRVPNLLVNGSEGIAVGMATKIPTHNLGEVIDACFAWLDDPEIDSDGLMRVLPGPDFPTRGVIVGRAGIREAYATGRGSIKVSGVAEIENLKAGKTRIVVSELPYGVNKARFQEKIVELVRDKVIEGISGVRDESDRKDSVRVVIDVRRDVDPAIVLNKLRRHTQLVTSFGMNAVCLDSRGRPRIMGLVEMIGEFVTFRRQVIRRRTVHDLDKARDSLHRQVGLYAAISMVDEVVRIIRNAADVDMARVGLMGLEIPTAGAFAELLAEADPDSEVGTTFRLSEIQANAILALSLRNLTGMERDRIAERARDLSAEIKGHLAILNDSAVLDGILRTELAEVKAKYPMERLTRIEASEMDALTDEDLIERQDVVITLTRSGYVKRTLLDAYREQRRGGKGRSGMDTKDDDFVTTTLVCSTKTPLLFFTSRGIAHALKAYALPEAAPNAKGRPLVNYVNLREGEMITAVLAMPEVADELQGMSLVFVTDFGSVRRNAAREFADVRKNGKIAVKLDDDNGNPVGRLMAVLLADDKDDVILATRDGFVTRFSVSDLRMFVGRNSTGVRGISLGKGDEVISASILRSFQATAIERQAYLDGGTTRWKEDGEARSFDLDPGMMEEMRAVEQELLTISALGYGKRSSAFAYRTTGRGGKGVAAALINRITGDLAACFPVADEDGLVIITDGGQTIRTRASDVRRIGRTGRGVRMFRLPEGQKIVSVARVNGDEISDEDVIQVVDEDTDSDAADAANDVG